jgi:hypothetical protein
MTDQGPLFAIEPYGDRWGVVIDDEVILVANTREGAESLVAEAVEVLRQSGFRRPPERRTFAGRDED